ncbi:MAG: FAD-dependent oxidoreductase [Pseudomonadota bacterium]
MGFDESRMKRREFLTRIGRTMGASAMLRAAVAMGLAAGVPGCGSSSASGGSQSPLPPAPPPPPPPNRMQSPRPGDWPANVGVGRSVIVLGAGIAGMTAALEMTRLGYSCSVLEATARAGGRNRTVRGGDVVTETDSSQTCLWDTDSELYFNSGPARIAHHHEFLLGYCREFGVALETFTNDNRAALLHSTNWFGGQPQIARRVLADSRGNIARLLTTAVNQNALDQELSAADRSNLLAMLQNFGALNGTTYTGSTRAGFPGQENVGSRQRGEVLPPQALTELLSDAQMLSRADFPHGLEQQPTMLQPVGGMDRIAQAFEAQVAQDITFEAVVQEIRKTPTGARVVYQDRFGAMQTVDADFCVCTIPATVLRSIPNDFAAAHNTEIMAFNYTQATKIAFQSRRFWEQDHNIYGGISWTNQNITQIWYPSSGFGQQSGILVGSYIFGGPAGTDFTNQSPQARINSTTTQANALHSQFGNEVTRGLSVAWPKVPFQLGAWGTSTPNVLLTPDDSIHFAGEHLSILQGWQEGAILSAYHAIDNVVADT